MKLTDISTDLLSENIMSRLIVEDGIDSTKLKKDLVKMIQGLGDDEKSIRVISRIKELISDSAYGGKLNAMKHRFTNSIKDVDVKKHIDVLARIVATVEMTPEEREQLFQSWEKDELINIDALYQDNVPFSDVIRYYDKQYMKDIVRALTAIAPYGIGPGEVMLSVLSKTITNVGAGNAKGDLQVGNGVIELKTYNKQPARFWDRDVKPSNSYASIVTKFSKVFGEPPAKSGWTDVHLMQLAANNYGGVENGEQKFDKLVTDLLKSILANNTGVASTLTKMIKTQDKSFRQTYGAEIIKNYLNAKGKLAGVLFMNAGQETFSFVKREEIGSREYIVKTPYLVTDQSSYPYPQTAVK